MAILNIPGVVAFKDVRNTIRRHPTKRYPKRSAGQIKHLAIHHSLTTSGTAEAFANYHVGDLGWPGVAYMFVIERNGLVKMTMDLTDVGYHVGNSNTRALGICVVGDLRSQEPTKEQYVSLYATVDFLEKLLSISVPNVRGHQEFPGYSWKQCPALDMDMLRGYIAAGIVHEVANNFQNDDVIVVDKVVVPKLPLVVKKNSNPDYYVIQEGDTIFGLANNADNLTVEDILKLNPGVDPRNLKIGQRIRMKKVAVATPVKKPVAKPAPASKLTAPAATIREGAKGASTLALQKCLSSLHFYPEKGAKNNGCDGAFGGKTKDALKRFQLMHGLTSDGIYGPNTAAKLKSLMK